MKRIINLLSGNKKYIIIISISVLFTLLACEKEVSVSPHEANIPTGSLSISSSPANYQIYIDGKISGKLTPDSLTFLEDGTYSVALKNDIYLDTTFTVTISNGSKEDAMVDVGMSPNFMGRIECTSTPSNVLISVDDSNTGMVTPAIIPNLYPGYHKITLSQVGCRDVTGDVLVRSNEANSFYGSLQDTLQWLDYTTNNSQIPSDGLLCMSIDLNGDGSVWTGSSDAGVIKIDPPVWTNFNMGNSPLESNRITDIYMSDVYGLMVTTYSGAYLYHDNTWDVFKSDNTILPTDQINAVTFDEPDAYSSRSDNFIIGTQGGGVVFYNIEDGTWIVHNSNNSNIPSNNISCLGITARSTIGLGTSDNGFALMNQTFNFNPYSWVVYTTENSNLLSNRISAITPRQTTQDAWVGLILSSVQEVIGTLMYGGQTPFVEVDIDGARVYSIVVDFSTVWVGTDNGLYKIEDFMVVDHLTKENSSLNSNQIYSVKLDRTGKVWMATGEGIIRYAK